MRKICCVRTTVFAVSTMVLSHTSGKIDIASCENMDTNSPNHFLGSCDVWQLAVTRSSSLTPLPSLPTPTIVRMSLAAFLLMNPNSVNLFEK